MKNSVIIKSFQHGISLHLPIEEDMETVLEKIAFKFKESATFFKDAKMVLSIEGRALSDEEERAVIDTVGKRFSSYAESLIINHINELKEEGI